jgi:L-Ala-D/L-Glu epimerase
MRSFEHAAAARDLAEAIIVRVDFAAGPAGWGETLPRPYVTGETLETVAADLERVFWPAVAGKPARAEDVPAIAAAGAGGAAHRIRNAAACAIELAMADAAMRRGEVIGGAPSGAGIKTRVSGVLGSADPARTARALWKMRLFGLRDFKLKMGFAPDIDEENLRLVHRRLRRGLRSGKFTLRVDANSAWPAEAVPDRAASLAPCGVCVLEQPTRAAPAEMAALARRCSLPLMADETLLTAGDAEILAEEPRVWWNIRVSKNGGLLPALELCRLARRRGVPFVVGCLVGESGILSAAQRRLLERSPAPRFVEGNYGRFLLRDDLAAPSPRFGHGGRLKTLRGEGLGVRVVEEQLRRYGRLTRTLVA